MKDITISSGNVFEDMELSEPADRPAKAELARKIAEVSQIPPAKPEA